MSSAGSRIGRRALPALALVFALYACFPASPFVVAQTAPAETRGLWVLRTSLTSPESIATLVRSAHDHGFNTLFVQVRGRGDAYYRGGMEPRPADLVRQP